MTKIENNARIQTLKRMLSVAKTLVENESNEIFELAHHISDNILNKICMLVGIEKEGENSIYEFLPGKRKKTKDFYNLYKILKKHYPNVPKYNDLIKRCHRDRNMYSHDITSLDLSIRKPVAKNYIKYVEDILVMVGYLRNESIKPSSLISNILSTDSKSSLNSQLTQKFKDLYNKLASKNPNVIEVKSLVQEIGEINIGKVLKMEFVQENKERILLKEHGRWTLSIRSGASEHLRLIKYMGGGSPTYDFKEPIQNKEFLNEYLELIKKKLEE